MQNYNNICMSTFPKSNRTGMSVRLGKLNSEQSSDNKRRFTRKNVRFSKESILSGFENPSNWKINSKGEWIYKPFTNRKTLVSKRKSPTRRGKGKRGNNTLRPKHLDWKFESKIDLLPVICNLQCDFFSIEEYRNMLQIHKKYIQKLVRNHGFEFASKLYKKSRTYVFSLIEGCDKDNPYFTKETPVEKIKYLKNWIHLYDLALRASEGEEIERAKAYASLNTIMYCTRILEENYFRDISSITEKAGKIDPKIKQKFQTYVRKTVESKGIKDILVKTLADRQLRLQLNNNSNGPNSKKRLSSLYQELLYLVNSDFFDPYTTLCKNVKGGDKLSHYMESFKGMSPIKGTLIRKIAQVTSPDLKVRDVAMVDYWTQVLLSSYEGAIYEVFEKVYPENVKLKSHDSGFNRAISFNKEISIKDPKGVNSYDISDWTDRLHRDLQYIVMSECFDEETAKAWLSLVVTCPWYFKPKDCTVYYGQGQGMGTRGSMAIATLTYIMYVQFKLSEHYTTEDTSLWSCVVGDDIWSYDPDTILPKAFEDIYLPVNSKGKKGTDKGRYIEFVSRTAFNEIDVSRISSRVINQASDWKNLPALLIVAMKRGLDLPASSFEYLNKTASDGITYLQKLQNLMILLLQEDLLMKESIEALRQVNNEELIVGFKDRILGLDTTYLERNGYLPKNLVFSEDNEIKIIELSEDTRNFFLISKFIISSVKLNSNLEKLFDSLGEVPYSIKSAGAVMAKAIPFDMEGDLYKAALDFFKPPHESSNSFLVKEGLLHPNLLVSMESLIQAQRVRSELMFKFPVKIPDNPKAESVININIGNKLIEGFSFKKLSTADYGGDKYYKSLSYEMLDIIKHLDINKRTIELSGDQQNHLRWMLDEDRFLKLSGLPGFPTLVGNDKNKVNILEEFTMF